MATKPRASGRRAVLSRRGRQQAGRDGLALDVVELGRLPRRLSVQQTVRAPLVEVQHPISDDLKPDTANHRRLSARRAIINCGKRQKPTGLRAVFRLLRQTTQLGRTKISAQWYRSRHDEPPRFAMLNQSRAHPGIAQSQNFRDPILGERRPRCKGGRRPWPYLRHQSNIGLPIHLP